MRNDDRNDIGRLRAERQAGLRRSQAAGVFAVCCLVSALLNGAAIRDSLARMPYGRARQAWLAVAEPLARVSAWTRLSGLRDFLDRRFHSL